MSTLQEFLEKTRKRGLLWWLSFYFNQLIDSIKFNKASNKTDNNWKNVKIKSTYTPEGYNKENVFAYLNNHYKDSIWKR